MSELIRPHGGKSELVSRTVAEGEAAGFRRDAAGLKKVPVSDADLSSLYRLGDGGLSPLTGPMDRTTTERVLNDEIILHDGKQYAWTIPIVFPVTKELAASLKAGETVALNNSRDEIVGTLHVRDVFP